MTGRYASTFRLMVLVVAGLALLTVIQQYFLHNSTTFFGFSRIPLAADIGAATPRHSGPEADVNFWGRTIVLFVPLALSLAVMRSERRRWWVWALAAGTLAAGEYLTQFSAAASWRLRWRSLFGSGFEASASGASCC